MAIPILVLATAVAAHGAAVIIDHTCADLAKIPETAILLAKKNLHIAYGHTSHGSQLITGMNGIVAFMNGKGYPNNLFSWNETGTGGALHLDDYAFSGAEDLGNPDFTAWEAATRTYLSAHPLVNVVIWSWCGQVSGATEGDITTYLSLMNQLEIDYPNVKFVYMTGHLDGQGSAGNLNVRNNQIRAFCVQNNKTLYDFADIESYDPDAQAHYMPLMATDNCDYDSDGNGSRDKNWATDWQSSHTLNVDWFSCSPAHTQALNGNRKGYAAWWLWAMLAGWNGENQVDLLGTWDDQGVAYRNSQSGGWAMLGTPADAIAAGDLDGDGRDDLIGVWPGQQGLWAQLSETGAWALLSVAARDFAAADMNGDGRPDLVGTYDGQGVFYRDSVSGGWVLLATPAEQVAAADLTGDGKADLIGIWPGQGGAWMKNSATGEWSLLASSALDIATGEMNGDARMDFVGTWSGQGVFYRHSQTGAWTLLSTPSTQVAAGDLDDDGRADLIGVWPGQNGVWVRYSRTGNWALLSSTAKHIGAGYLRGGMGSAGIGPFGGGVIAAPGWTGFRDLSDFGPGGTRFRFAEEKNLVPHMTGPESVLSRLPGPGEPGFRFRVDIGFR